jgi:tetratricopeptide (TPR) repeat protein
VVTLGLWGVVAFGFAPEPAVAQARPQDRLAEMQEIARALGVGCDYCHKNMRGGVVDPAGPEGVLAPVPEPKKAIALEMMAMTRELNARVQAATGKSAADATTVRCATCHRGVTIPMPLSDLVTRTILQEGVGAAVTQYRDLRARYYGRASYDFGEDELLSVAQRFIQVRPADAIALLQMNLEFHPDSPRTYAALGYAHTRTGDDAAAIPYLERALELQPENGTVRGQLEQLRRFQRR